MKGTNPIRKMSGPDDPLRVKEVFYTIQGEGPLAGRPALFVRMAGCNLKCWFCDTDFEGEDVEEFVAVRLSLFIESKLKENGCRLVVFTGGEPLLQPRLSEVMSRLNSVGVSCQVETAGSVWHVNFDDVITGKPHCMTTMVVSPKTPTINPMVAQRASAWKYIVRADELDEDGLPNRSTQQKKHKLVRLARPWDFLSDGKGSAMFAPRNPPEGYLGRCYAEQIFLQPCDEGDARLNARNATAAAAACMKYGYRLSIQTHKVVGLP